MEIIKKIDLIILIFTLMINVYQKYVCEDNRVNFCSIM